MTGPFGRGLALGGQLTYLGTGLVLCCSQYCHSTSICCSLFDENFASSNWFRNSHIQFVAVRLPKFECNPFRRITTLEVARQESWGFARAAAPAHFVGRSKRNAIALRRTWLPHPTPSLLFPPFFPFPPLRLQPAGCSQRAHWHGSRVAPYSKCVSR